jgi:hypothetical protein
MSEAPKEGISERRAHGISNEACQILTGLNALSEVGGWHDGDSVPAVQVRWFCKALKQHAEKILVYSDQAEDEPEAA